MGNLVRQENAIARFAEDYRYDELMRVDNSTKTINGTTYAPVNYDYDAAGNIVAKSDYGSSYLYGNVGKGLGGNAGPNAIRQFIRGGTTYNFTYDNNGNRLIGDGATLTYDDQNKPLIVARNGTTSTFSYDANGQRYKQVKQQGSSSTTTYYVGSFEREVSSSATIDKTYIGDHTIKMKAHVGSLGNQSPFQHLLRDHLGSVDTLIDGQTGAVLQYRGYDVFGRPRDIAAGNALLTVWQGVTKGYTDHEHLNEQQLIHMNGRIYDFNVGRFLSVDPFLQFPKNSQSANPYSYILNNPMSGTDPTGYAATGGGCSTGSNTGFEGFCTSVQLAETESKKKNKATVGNGEANGRLTISGEAKRVGEVGLQLEKSGGKLVSGQTNLDGSATATYSFGGGSSGGWSYGKYNDLYAETASTIGNGAAVTFGNLIPDMVNGITDWTERFLHQDSGSLGRMDQWVDVDNEVAQGVANDFRKIAAVGTAMVPVLRRSTSSLMEQYNFANSPALHMTNPARYVPVQLLEQAIKGSKGFPDPQGSVALMHYMRIWRNENPYNLEVLYHKNTNTILHFEYARKKMGPLDAIKK